MEKSQFTPDTGAGLDPSRIAGPPKYVTLEGVGVEVTGVGNSYYRNHVTGTIGAFCDMSPEEAGTEAKVDEAQVAEATSLTAPAPEIVTEEAVKPPAAKVTSQPSEPTMGGWSSGGMSIY